MSKNKNYWTKRYVDGNIGWDIGTPSTPHKEYADQLSNKELSILIPGAGNAYEAEYLHSNGFTNVTVLDISELPLQQLKKRVPSFPEDHLVCQDFFEHNNTYDLILEQTFFCSFEPTSKNRFRYVEKMASLLNSNGKLVGLWFNHPLDQEGERPFGGSKEEYITYLSPRFSVETFEDCYNSIPPRLGKELFGIFSKR